MQERLQERQWSRKLQFTVLSRVIPKTNLATKSGTIPISGTSPGDKVKLDNESNNFIRIQFGVYGDDILPPWTMDMYTLPDKIDSLSYQVESTLGSSGSPDNSIYGVFYAQSESVHGSFPMAMSRQSNVGNSVDLNVQKGTSFPVSPSQGDQFFRTDLGLQYFWDGAGANAWLTVQQYEVEWTRLDSSLGLPPISSAGGGVSGLLNPFYRSYIESFSALVYLSALHSAVNYYTIAALIYKNDNTGTAITSTTTQNMSVSWNTWNVQFINYLTAANETIFEVNFTRSGAPAGIHYMLRMQYRLVGP